MTKISLSPSPQRQDVLFGFGIPHLPRDRMFYSGSGGCEPFGNGDDQKVPTKPPWRTTGAGCHHRPCITVVYEGEGLAGSPVLPPSDVCQVGQSPIHHHLTLPYQVPSIPISFSPKVRKFQKGSIPYANKATVSFPISTARRKLWENKSFLHSWPYPRAVLASPSMEKQTRCFFSVLEAERRNSVNPPHKSQIPNPKSQIPRVQKF